MNKENLEECIFSVIGYSGMAKYYASEAIKSAKNGDFKEAEEFLKNRMMSFQRHRMQKGLWLK